MNFDYVLLMCQMIDQWDPIILRAQCQTLNLEMKNWG